jgi:hypothetical protein
MPTFLGIHATDFDSNPFDVVDARLHGGLIHTISSVDEVPDTANADVLIIARVPVDAVIKSVRSANDALGAGTMDLGLYRKNSDGTYTAVDDDCFASAIAVTSANALTDVTYEAAAANIALRNQSAWQRAGLASRPAYGDLYIAATFDAGTSTVATLLTEIDYTL